MEGRGRREVWMGEGAVEEEGGGRERGRGRKGGKGGGGGEGGGGEGEECSHLTHVLPIPANVTTPDCECM